MHTYSEYNRDTLWGTVDGRQIPIRCMTDTHLANTINHLNVNREWYDEQLMEVLLKEALDKGLSKEFLDSAPIPWQDVDGKWKRLNKEQNDYEVIGR